MKDEQIIRPKDVGSLEDALGPDDPLFRPELGDWEKGRREGHETALRQYARWKDGVEYVGTCSTCGITLEQALKNMKK